MNKNCNLFYPVYMTHTCNAPKFKRTWSGRGKNASIAYEDKWFGWLRAEHTKIASIISYKTVYLQTRKDKIQIRSLSINVADVEPLCSRCSVASFEDSIWTRCSSCMRNLRSTGNNASRTIYMYTISKSCTSSIRSHGS